VTRLINPNWRPPQTASQTNVTSVLARQFCMKAAITGFLGVLGLGTMVSCSDPGGQVASDTALPAANSYNGGSSVQEVHLRQQWYSTHLTGAAQLDQLLQETAQHGNGR
jgi:hypothetical protein